MPQPRSALRVLAGLGVFAAAAFAQEPTASAAPAAPTTEPFRFAGAPCTAPPPLHCPDQDCPGDRVINQGAVVEPKSRRTFFLDYPCDLEPGENVTFVLSLHGGGSYGNWQRHYFPLLDWKDRYRLVIATPHSPTRAWSEADDEYLRNVVTFVYDQLGAENVRAFWLAGHSQGGQTSNRLLTTDFFRRRLTGWVSLSGGRLGSKREEIRAPIPGPPPGGATPGGAGAGPPRLVAYAENLPDFAFSHIYTSGEHELTAAGLPDSSRWAERLGCVRRERLDDVSDARAGYVYDGSGNRAPSAVWGGKPAPGVAQVFVYGDCPGGDVVADVVRLGKGHTEGLEPAVTETIVKLMIAARGGAPAGGDSPSASPGASAAERLAALFAEEWEVRLRENPLFATSTGDHRYDDRLPEVTRADQDRRAALDRGWLAALAAIDRTGLDRRDQVSAAMFERALRDRLLDWEFGGFEIPVNADSGFHSSFAQLAREMPFATVRDYENYLARLRAFPRYTAQHIANMRAGLARGMSLPRVVLEGYEVTIATHVVADPEQSVFWPPFARFPPGVPEGERERLRALGREAVLQAVVPGYRAFLDFMTDEYLPKTRTTLGASELPRGREYYQYTIGSFTTLDLTALDIHQLGLREVARIRGEMEAVIAKTGFAGSFEEFLHFLRTDPRFYARTPLELLKEASTIAKRMDAKLPSLFGTLPRLPYGVAPVPDAIAPKYTGGRYVGPAEGSTEPGYYWVNTYNLASRPLYVLESLTLHEAVPGHHLQTALATEQTGLPPFRRFEYISAFGEGWGLYSEWLGLEAGFYQDPYSNFGRLTYEMWRACRLVVDTGVHAFGWTRERMMDFLARNTALSLHEVKTETDRYISWPGQALAYKLGELQIRALRQRAERELGGRFDLRRFHDAVLRNGSVPLPVLEEEVVAWIAAEKSAGPAR